VLAGVICCTFWLGWVSAQSPHRLQLQPGRRVNHGQSLPGTAHTQQCRAIQCLGQLSCQSALAHVSMCGVALQHIQRGGN
jgi:hypothetical protein